MISTPVTPSLTAAPSPGRRAPGFAPLAVYIYIYIYIYMYLHVYVYVYHGRSSRWRWPSFASRPLGAQKVCPHLRLQDFRPWQKAQKKQFQLSY